MFCAGFFNKNIVGKVTFREFEAEFKKVYPTGKKVSLGVVNIRITDVSDYLLVKGVGKESIETFGGKVTELGSSLLAGIFGTEVKKLPSEQVESAFIKRHCGEKKGKESLSREGTPVPLGPTR